MAKKIGPLIKKQESHKSLVAAVNEISSLVDQRMAHLLGADIVGGDCVFMAIFGKELLAERGIDTTLVGGRAAFGFNRGKFGVIDFGYPGNHNFHPHIEDGIESFIGHAWLEVDDDVVIDFSFPNLQKLVRVSNEASGIVGHDAVEIDTSQIVIRRDEMVSENVRQETMLGRYYSRPIRSITEQVNSFVCLVKILE
jgi:hypothetical protein